MHALVLLSLNVLVENKSRGGSLFFPTKSKSIPECCNTYGNAF